MASLQDGFTVASCKVLAGRWGSRWLQTQCQADLTVIADISKAVHPKISEICLKLVKHKGAHVFKYRILINC